MRKIALIVLLSCLFLEIALRFAPEPRFAANIVFDRILGHRGPKDIFVEIEGQRLYYNHFGFRDRPYDPEEESAKEQVRVVALGDSITEAIMVPEASVWTQWLENILNAALKKPSAVYKFASSDWGTYQELLALEKHEHDLKSDVVVLQFLGLNDFTNNSLSLAGKNRSENDGWRPYYNVHRPWLSAHAQEPAHYLRSWSYIFRFLDAIYVNRHVYGMRALERRQGPCDPILGLFREDIPSEWQDAYRTTNGIAAQFGRRKEKHKKILAVYFPSHVEVVDDLWRSVIEQPLRACAPEAKIERHMPEFVFENAFRSAGIEVFSLRDAFLKEKDPKGLFDDSGHLSLRGHQVAGEQIAFYLYNHHPELFGGKK